MILLLYKLCRFITDFSSSLSLSKQTVDVWERTIFPFCGDTNRSNLYPFLFDTHSITTCVNTCLDFSFGLRVRAIQIENWTFHVFNTAAYFVCFDYFFEFIRYKSIYHTTQFGRMAFMYNLHWSYTNTTPWSWSYTHINICVYISGWHAKPCHIYLTLNLIRCVIDFHFSVQWTEKACKQVMSWNVRLKRFKFHSKSLSRVRRREVWWKNAYVNCIWVPWNTIGFWQMKKERGRCVHM